MRRRAPRRVGVSVGAFTQGLAPASVLGEVQGAWADAVGPAVAREAQPTAERDGTVTVSCASAVWAQELELMGPVVVERLNAHITRRAVASLRCRVASPMAPARQSADPGR